MSKTVTICKDDTQYTLYSKTIMRSIPTSTQKQPYKNIEEADLVPPNNTTNTHTAS